MSHVTAVADAQPAAVGSIYAGFWRRFFAYMLDWILVGAVVSIVFVLLGVVIPGLERVDFSSNHHPALSLV